MRRRLSRLVAAVVAVLVTALAPIIVPSPASAASASVDQLVLLGAGTISSGPGGTEYFRFTASATVVGTDSLQSTDARCSFEGEGVAGSGTLSIHCYYLPYIYLSTCTYSRVELVTRLDCTDSNSGMQLARGSVVWHYDQGLLSGTSYLLEGTMTYASESLASGGSTDAMFVLGNGSVSPGLTLAPAPQVVSVSGWANVAGSHQGTYSCSFTGTGLADNSLEGLGTFAGGCGPITLNTCIFVRVGFEVAVSCLETGSPVKASHGHFMFVPDQSPPATITSFQLQGGALYVDM